MPRYARSYGGYQFDIGSYFPPGIKALCIACGAVFCLQQAIKIFGGLQAWALFNDWFGLVPLAVTHGFRIWQPVTYLFLHASIWHILINLLFLAMFGAGVEHAWGTRRFVNYFFICGIGAGLVNVIVKTIIDPHGVGSAAIPTIGASGAIYGVLLAAAIVMPHARVLVFFVVTVPMRIFVIAMGAIEFFSTFGETGDSVSHVCHLGGMLVGYLYLRRGSFLYNIRNYFSDWKRRRLRKKFDLYVRDHQDKPPSHPDNWVN